MAECRVLAGGPGDRAEALSHLGFALMTRYERNGSRADLSEGEMALRRSASLTSRADSDASRRWANVATLVHKKFLASDDTALLDELVTTSRQSVRVATRRSDQHTSLHDLGYAVKARYNRLGRLEDLLEAADITRRSMESFGAGCATCVESRGMTLWAR